ncbi:MAG TPA: hypothetical protein VFI04_03540 [Gaiellaceae bacterium]|nr:hypothetical protein [Gaiellaceae bacterium]
MSNETDHRDERLGAALRALDQPEHRPEFHRELRGRLSAERRASRRRWAWPLAAAATAAAVAVALIAIGIPRTHKTPSIAGPQPASAALVKSHLREALTAMRNLSGMLVATEASRGTTERWRFVLDVAGDVRLEGPGDGEVVTYDSSTGVARSIQHSASMGGSALFYAERTGVAPGPPDLGPPSWLIPERLGAYVRAALASRDPGVREVTYEGRAAWRLDVHTVPNAVAPELSGDELQVTVDRRTGMPVLVVEQKQGKVLRTLRLGQLAVDTAPAAGAFRAQFPAGAEVMRSDDGFQRVPLARAAGVAGYRPLVPDRVPAGYELAEVAVARESAPTGKEGGNPRSQGVVSLSYRRGLDQFLVTTRLRGNGTWSDPLASGEGFVDHPDRVDLPAGALAGADAELVLSPRALPHLWALTDDLVVTVGGDLSRSELTRVAGSLRAR